MAVPTVPPLTMTPVLLVLCIFGPEKLVILNGHLSNRKLWSSGRALGSQSDGCGLNHCPVLDGSGVKAMQGSMPAPNSGSL